MKNLLTVILILWYATIIKGATYWTSPTGAYVNPGTYALPFNWAKGQTLLTGGDTLMFKNGTYTATSAAYMFTTTLDGSAGNYIVYKAETTGSVIIDGNNFLGYDAFSLGNYVGGGASYIIVEGFEIRNMFYSGFEVQNSDYVTIKDCWIHHIGNVCTEDGSGLVAIAASNCDHMIVERCKMNNIGRLGLNEGGCTPSSDYWKNHDHAMYINGMTNFIVRNNIFYNNLKGWSVHFYGPGPCSNVEVINNTFYNGGPRAEAMSHVVIWLSMTNCLIANNIFHTQYATGVYAESGGAYTYSNINITKNIVYGGTGLILQPTSPPSGITKSNNYENKNPLMANPATYDFTLQSNSPAINTGYNTGLTTDFVNHPRTVIDIGAYEYYTEPVPPEPSDSSSGYLTKKGRVVTADGKVIYRNVD